MNQSGPSIMLVDDQPENLNLLEAMLRLNGYRTRSFPSGQRALAAVALQPPDLVLLDIAMPGTSGFDVCRHMKANPAHAEIPVLFLSALTDTEAKVKALRAGGVDFITKPFQFEEVYARIETHLKLRDLQRELKRQNDGLEQTVQMRTRELAEANAQLRISEELFRLFMRHLPAAAFIKDQSGRYIWGNAAWRNQFPDSLGELAGKTDSDLWPAETAAAMASSDARVLDGAGALQFSETATNGSDRRQWLVSKFSIQGKRGAALIGCVSLDTTENQRLEAQLRQAQKLEAIGLLAGGVAHDFNNLLTIILGHADVGVRSTGDHQIRHKFEQIRDASLRAADLTRQLLAFGRKQTLLPSTISMNEELSRMEPILRRLIRENVSLSFSLMPDTGLVDIDPVQFQQVVFNLAMNAQDAMVSGGNLSVETTNIEIGCNSPAMTCADSLEVIPPGHYAMLAVTDTGCGMDAGTLAHVFEPFFTTKGLGRGTGLGLATVYGIVRQSGGHIGVYSEPGRGSSFRICFPKTANAGATGDRQAPAAESRSQHKPTQTVLIVEDEESLRSLMAEVCVSAGYQVLSAARADEAVILAGSHPGPIHLLVSDMVLPDAEGRKLAERILDLRPETEVLFCSGYEEKPIVQQQMPRSEFLQKPFTPSELLERIRSLLSRPCAKAGSFAGGH